MNGPHEKHKGCMLLNWMRLIGAWAIAGARCRVPNVKESLTALHPPARRRQTALRASPHPPPVSGSFLGKFDCGLLRRRFRQHFPQESCCPQGVWGGVLREEAEIGRPIPDDWRTGQIGIALSPRKVWRRQGTMGAQLN